MALDKEMLKGLFKDIGSATASKDANYPRAGQYYMRIESVNTDKNRKKEPILLVHLTCLHRLSNGTSCQYSGMEEHVVGEELADVYKMQGNDYFLPNVKSMLTAILGLNDAGTSDAEWMEACIEMCDEEEQPLAGMVIEMQNREVLKQNKKAEDPDCFYTKSSYKRTVPIDEIDKVLSDEVKERLFPQEDIDAILAAQEE